MEIQILPVIRFGSVGDLEELAKTADAHVILVPAAISDFLVEKESEIFFGADSKNCSMNSPQHIAIVSTSRISYMSFTNSIGDSRS